MGTDRAGNKYFENNEELPLRTRWVSYAKHDFDASHIEPGWHAWMSYMTEATPGAADVAAAGGSAKTLPAKPRPNPTMSRARSRRTAREYYGLCWGEPSPVPPVEGERTTGWWANRRTGPRGRVSAWEPCCGGEIVRLFTGRAICTYRPVEFLEEYSDPHQSIPLIPISSTQTRVQDHQYREGMKTTNPLRGGTYAKSTQ